MECGRMMIYFSTYENGVKVKRSGYAGIFIRGTVCDVQIYYRGEEAGQGLSQKIQPVYIFRDGTVTTGKEIPLDEGMAAATILTSRIDFMQSGRSLEELEVIYIDGAGEGICGGRPDGQELSMEAAYTLTETMPESIPETVVLYDEPERWTLTQCMEQLPELKLPFDGIRRKCCRMTVEDMEHMPEEWDWLKENHFLLHGYYEYHHLLLARLSCRYGERYAIGVPGEFCYRNQYMAESFGFYDFAPLEQGRRRGGSFGYWYYYLEK
ncbi:MAG: hypothetical protein J6K04_06240 [Lachnospiraceae bacterium]|nr:hypothetical protein [Lachnospiraceae bacterium]